MIAKIAKIMMDATGVTSGLIWVFGADLLVFAFGTIFCSSDKLRKVCFAISIL